MDLGLKNKTAVVLASSSGLGLGVAQDYVLAYMWSTLAADEDADFAAENRARLRKLMDAELIAEGEQLAAEWEPAE